MPNPYSVCKGCKGWVFDYKKADCCRACGQGWAKAGAKKFTIAEVAWPRLKSPSPGAQRYEAGKRRQRTWTGWQQPTAGPAGQAEAAGEEHRQLEAAFVQLAGLVKSGGLALPPGIENLLKANEERKTKPTPAEAERVGFKQLQAARAEHTKLLEQQAKRDKELNKAQDALAAAQEAAEDARRASEAATEAVKAANQHYDSVNYLGAASGGPVDDPDGLDELDSKALEERIAETAKTAQEATQRGVLLHAKWQARQAAEAEEREKVSKRQQEEGNEGPELGERAPKTAKVKEDGKGEGKGSAGQPDAQMQSS
jgi:hypothetical protein